MWRAFTTPQRDLHYIRHAWLLICMTANNNQRMGQCRNQHGKRADKKNKSAAAIATSSHHFSIAPAVPAHRL